MLTQLPDDVVTIGYRPRGRFEYVQVFYSPCNRFTGTEQEFFDAGLAYRYTELDQFRRLTITKGARK